MDNPAVSMAQQVAQAASAFQKQLTGLAPKAVTAALGEDTLLVALHGALSPAEKVLAKTPSGATRLQEFHRLLFQSAAESLRQQIERITGVAVREAAVEVEMITGTIIQVFQLAGSVSAETWSGPGNRF
ncbi:MAG: Na-translocating system protein MpsC family protein [Planctomycetaceae bacterium]